VPVILHGSLSLPVNSLDWLDSLPPAIASQRDLLRRLLAAVGADPRWRWLQVSCSVADGRADALSDLDLGLGVADERWESALTDLPVLLEGLAPTTGALYHRLPQFGDQTHLRAVIHYANGVQIDLVAVPAHLPRSRKPEDIMVYDPDGLLSQTWDPSVLQATPETVYEWSFLGWVALSDLAKYLRRGSVWEALERLQEARTQVWRLWAVAKGLRYPGFGLTEVLDHSEAGIPPGIEATVSPVDLAAIFHAASACADLLDETSEEARRVMGGSLPALLARFVRDRLAHAASATLAHDIGSNIPPDETRSFSVDCPVQPKE
jgi:hypothetical protein